MERDTRIGRAFRIETKSLKRKRVLTRQDAGYLGLTWAFDALEAQDTLAEVTLLDGRRIRKILK